MRYVTIALALTACGTVNGVCPGESNDNVACTADICDLETNQWVHIPESSACGSGEVCTATGCTASPLSGTAFLLGYDAGDATHNHAGITVTLVPAAGASGSASGSGSAASPLTATTAADGSWSIAAEPGTYTVEYSKDKFFTVTTPGVVVGANGGGVAPPVTLTHYQTFNQNGDVQSWGTAYYLPSELVTAVPNNDGDELYYATPLDASADTVGVLGTSYSNYVFGSTHIVWLDSVNGAVWSRPYDGSTPPVLLFSAPIGETVAIEGTPTTYTVILETGGGALDSLWVAKTDGSAPPTTPAWRAPDTNHHFAALANNDTTALFFSSATTADTQPAHRIDFASNMTVAVSVGVTSSGLYEDSLQESPDGNWVYGNIVASTGTPYRGFIAPLTPTPLSAGITVSALTGTYADVWDEEYYEWLPDSSAYVYTARGLTGGSADLREWKTSAASSAEIASPAAFDEAAGYAVGFYGSSVLHYSDYSNELHFYGLASAGTAVLDTSPSGVPWDVQSTIAANGDVYVVETEYAASGRAGRVASIAIPGGNVAAATATTLIVSIPSTCDYWDALSDTTFYQLCADTGTLTSYPKSTPTSNRQLTGVQIEGFDSDDTLLMAAASADQLVYVGSDYNLYSVTNDGAGEPALVSANCDPAQGYVTFGNWVFCADSQHAMTRVSKLDGSVIDEPFDTCNVLSNFEAYDVGPYNSYTYNPSPLHLDPTATRVWSPGAECVDGAPRSDGTSPPAYKESMTPLANLP